MSSDVQLEEFARAVADASPNLDAEEQQLAVETYRLLARGEPVTIPQISQATTIPGDRVEESLRSWPLVFWDDQNRIVGFWGLTVNPLEPTHEMNVNGTTVYGWCAWDTLFVTEILGEAVHVESTDPQNGATVRLTVTPDGVTDLSPAEAMVSLLLPGEGFTDSAIAGFCHKIHFFASPRSAEEWLDGKPGIFSVSVDQAFEVGRLTNRLRLGSFGERASFDR